MYKLGYTTGVFDLFHIGHLNLLKVAKGMCETLIVGVTTDELAQYKTKTPIIPFDQRIEILRSIKYVDVVIPQTDINKVNAYYKLKYDVLIVGDDWYNDKVWNGYQEDLKMVNVDVIYIPYTKLTSSTIIINTIKENNNE